MKLIAADICRDGGSLVADFVRKDGSLLSIMLEVAEIVEPGAIRRFRHLHVGPRVQNTCDPSTIVAKGTGAEEALLSELDAWIAREERPAYPDNRWQRLLELRKLMPTREV